MSEHSSQSEYFGIPIEEYQEPCRTCPRMAAWALKLTDLDFKNNCPPYPFPATREHWYSRQIFSRLGSCTDEFCGLEPRTKD